MLKSHKNSNKDRFENGPFGLSGFSFMSLQTNLYWVVKSMAAWKGIKGINLKRYNVLWKMVSSYIKYKQSQSAKSIQHVMLSAFCILLLDICTL